MKSWHQYPWRPRMLLFLLAAQLPLASLKQCDKNTYPSGDWCCHYCQAGFEMVSRCTDKEDTKCKPCATGLFNEELNYDFCKPCTQCSVATGSQVQRPCTAFNDTVCQCTPGTQPIQAFKWGVECIKCPPGHFSVGGNTMCRPWTNCTAIGKRTLRAGSSRADAECEDAKIPGTPRNPPTSPRTSATSSPTHRLWGTTRNLEVLTSPQPNPDKVLSQFSVIFLTTVIFMAFLIMLLAITYFSRKDKRPQPAICKPLGTNSFRMPIQEDGQDPGCLVKV